MFGVNMPAVAKTSRLDNLVITEITECDVPMNEHARVKLIKAEPAKGVTMTAEEIQKAQQEAIAVEVRKALAEERTASAGREAEAVAKAVKVAEEAGKTDLAKAQDRIAAIEKAGAVRDQIDIAKGLPNIEGTPEAVGDLLYRLHKADAEVYREVVAKFRAADIQLGKSELINKARGQRGDPSGVGTKLAVEVGKAMAADRDLTKEAATVRVLEANPELYDSAQE